MTRPFERIRDEVRFVEECPHPDCEVSFVGVDPDEARDHAETHDPLYSVLVWSRDERGEEGSA